MCRYVQDGFCASHRRSPPHLHDLRSITDAPSNPRHTRCLPQPSTAFGKAFSTSTPPPSSPPTRLPRVLRWLVNAIPIHSSSLFSASVPRFQSVSHSLHWKAMAQRLCRFLPPRHSSCHPLHTVRLSPLDGPAHMPRPVTVSFILKASVHASKQRLFGSLDVILLFPSSLIMLATARHRRRCNCQAP